MLRIWPQRVRGDGHFAARLRKSGGAALPEFLPERPDREIAALLAQLEGEIAPLPDGLKRRFLRAGDRLWAVPAACPELRGLRVVSPGVQLLRAGKNYIEPAHALAMALDADGARQSMTLDDEQAKRYLAGEALSCAAEMKGWALILWRGLALGWGKASGGQMKNHLPKGLRLSLH